MKEQIFKTPYGDIHYYINIIDKDQLTYVFLPGLTADHRLFDKQLEYFEGKVNVFVWDAPGHLASRPFKLEFKLEDKTTWLKEILEKEEITKPLLIGQSMGGYVSQMFLQLYPGIAKGFISIDSAPLQKSYMTGIEIWLLENIEPMYRWYPWKALLRDGAKGCATTEYGQKLMYDMMSDYDHKEYARLAGHGYRMLAWAVKENLPYEIDCPALLICGEVDKAGSAKNYNKRWHAKTGIPIAWIKDAGHNSNSDKPEEINQLIEEFAGGTLGSV